MGAQASASSRTVYWRMRGLGAYEALNLTGAEAIDANDARPPAKHARNHMKCCKRIIGSGRPATQQQRRRKRARAIQIDLYEHRASGPFWRASGALTRVRRRERMYCASTRLRGVRLREGESSA